MEEDLLDSVIDRLYIMVGDMLIFSEKEMFESAAETNARIKNSIKELSKSLVSKKMTKLTGEEIEEFLKSTIEQFRDEWSETLEIPDERRPR